MRRHARVKNSMTAAIVTGAVMLAMPSAGAVTPEDVIPDVAPLTSSVVDFTTEITGTEVASADVVDSVRAQLSGLGMQVPGVDKAVTDAIDHAIVTHVPNTRLKAEQVPVEGDTAENTGTPVVPGLSSLPGERATYSDGEALVPEEQAGLDQNYRWVNDPVSRIMAGKPSADWILHRVPVSWFDAPRIPEESMIVQDQGASLYGPGTPVIINKSKVCTIGVVGTDAEGRKVGITAGHCGDPGEKVWSADSWQVGASGTVVTSNKLHDYSVVELGSNTQISRTYNGVTVNSIGGPTRPGDILCKQGVATGHTCGNVWTADEEIHISQLCAMVGDSGAPVMAGDRMVGLVSGGVLSDQRFSCRTPLQGQLFMPTVSTSMDVVLQDMDTRGGVGAGFRLAD